MQKIKENKKLLLVILLLLVGIGVTLAYFFNRNTFANLFISRDAPIIITEEDFESPSDWVPGTTTKKVLDIINENDYPVGIRVKFEESWEDSNGNSLPLYTDGGIRASIINFINTDKWKEADDGYYYYDGSLASNNTAESPIASVTFNENVEGDITCTTDTSGVTSCSSSGNSYDGGKYKLKITTEMIDYDNYDVIWNPTFYTCSAKILSSSNSAQIAINESIYVCDDLINDDPDKNVRYVGVNPDNYVSFNDELWRIIGVFAVEDGNGNLEERIKLIRSEDLGDVFVIDSSELSINEGYGINEWSQADLMYELNGDYLDTTLTTDTYWYNAIGNQITSDDLRKTGGLFDHTKALDTKSQNLIENAIWYLGSPTNDNGQQLIIYPADETSPKLTAPYIYTQERKGLTGKICSSGNRCNDNVTRTTNWTGKVGLMYPSDYLFATEGSDKIDRETCLTKVYGSSWSDCFTNNWLTTYKYQGTISPLALEISSSGYIKIHAIFGLLESSTVDEIATVRPVVYLKSSVKIISGTGTTTDPFVIE